MVKETTLEISLSALKHNYLTLRSRLSSKAYFLAVVKAFGYGGEAVSMAKCLESLGVNYFAVAYVNEGVALRKAGIKTPILVLHPQPLNFKTAIEFDLEPSLYSFRVLNEFINTTKQLDTTEYPIHVKFNTGLNRLGLNKEDIETISPILKNNKSVHVVSVFSHLAASDDLEEKSFTENQIDEFKSIAAHFENRLGYRPIRHLCNTSGVINYPQAEFEMVRCGIGLYGYDNKNTDVSELKPVMALKTVISQIHQINKNESVGYNRAFVASEPKKIATLPLGHADGIGRQYGNGVGSVIINGQNAPIVGNVCMDMVMVDITNISCSEGDQVIIFDSSRTASALAQKAGTISYELLTAISQRIKRVIVP